jgi:REP element-mobilizing transposase RayT
LVCVTKYRKNVLTAEGLKLIKDSFDTVAYEDELQNTRV